MSLIEESLTLKVLRPSSSSSSSLSALSALSALSSPSSEGTMLKEIFKQSYAKRMHEMLDVVLDDLEPSDALKMTLPPPLRAKLDRSTPRQLTQPSRAGVSLSFSEAAGVTVCFAVCLLVALALPGDWWYASNFCPLLVVGLLLLLVSFSLWYFQTPHNEEKKQAAPGVLAELIQNTHTYFRLLTDIRKEFVTRRCDKHQQIIHAYVNDIWLGEFDPPRDVSTEELLRLTCRDDKEGFESKLKGTAKSAAEVDNLWMTMKNLHALASQLFDKNPESIAFNDDGLLAGCSIDAAKAINKALFQGVTAKYTFGEYREHNVGAAGMDVDYADFKDVPLKMEALFECLKQQMAGSDMSLEKGLRLGSWFFREFLLIHPFSDGNGRTARLLLSLLLRDVTVVPVSLYVASLTHDPKLSPRDLYIDTLNKAQMGCAPYSVLPYVIFCAHRQAERLYNLIYS